VDRKITWLAHGWKRILGQRFIFRSHASTAYLEERKENKFFERKKVLSHTKRKIVVPLEQEVDSSGVKKMAMTMMKSWQMIALLTMTGHGQASWP
jgi:hypothetical protein